MKTQVIEGTLEEVQKQLSALPFLSNKRLRVVISETEPHDQSLPHSSLQYAKKRNGLILLPTKKPEEVVTVEMVKELSED